MLQESLTNILKHSGSSTAEISIESEDQNAVLCIRGQGKGIPPRKLKAFRETGLGVGVGLDGMKQRVRELGGQLQLDSSSSGTCLKASLPVKPLAAETTSAAD